MKLAVQEMRVAMEWRRWEQADKWHWNPRKRQRWAQGLWRAQHVSTCCLYRLSVQLAFTHLPAADSLQERPCSL